MILSRSAVVTAAFLSLIGLSTPCAADESWQFSPDRSWQSFVNEVSVFEPGPPTIFYVGEPQNLAAPNWYKHWLYLHQNSTSAALYNQPCFMSDSENARPVRCQRVAIAESPVGAPLIVAGAYLVEPGVYGRPHQYRRGHRYAAVKAKY